MKKEDLVAIATNNVATSREKHFLRAWRKVERLSGDPQKRLQAALILYEYYVVQEEWDNDIPFALENPEDLGVHPLDFGGLKHQVFSEHP